MDVAVLGCGPAGLMAAHAAKQEFDANVIIYSVPKKSQITGAQYLHEAIPGLCEPTPDAYITYLKHGTRNGYAEKVYGRADAPCSWDGFEQGQYPAWQLERVYNRLWHEWFDSIIEYTVDPTDIPLLLEDNDLVISAIPKPGLCMYDHEFKHKSIWIADYNNLPTDAEDNVILYNGDPLDHWYRASRLWGHDSTESTDPMEGAVRGVKPLSNNCNCWDGKIACVGRFGLWEKGVLVNHAYKNALEACSALQQV